LGRGRFEASAVEMTAQALVMYALGMTGLGAVYVLQRAFYAMSDGTTPLVVGTIVVFAHIVLNLVLIPSMAHAGIALSASITTLAGVVALLALLARRVPGIALSSLSTFLIRCFMMAGISTVLVVWLFGSLHLDTETVTARLIGVGLVGAGSLIYFLLALLTRTHESEMLLETARGFLKLDGRRKTEDGG
jgi:putative peptidoglycan lipid II flippase